MTKIALVLVFLAGCAVSETAGCPTPGDAAVDAGPTADGPSADGPVMCKLGFIACPPGFVCNGVDDVCYPTP